MSLAFHMLAHGGDISNLFHGVFLVCILSVSDNIFQLNDICFCKQSGPPFLLRPPIYDQANYDSLISLTGCSDAAKESGHAGLECLRSIPSDDLITAINKLPNTFDYQSFSAGWRPTLDENLFDENPRISLRKKVVAKAE